jgi:hypothetical protein
VIGVRWGLQMALWCGAASMLSGFVVYRWRLAAVDEVKTDPVDLWAEPELSTDIDPESGPALVTIEYLIDHAKTGEFIAVMRDQRTMRLRDGAIFWGLFVDITQPDRFVEIFVNETWLEHLREHHRMIASDVALMNLARSFSRADKLRITHLISADALAGRNVGTFDRNAGRTTAVIEPLQPTLKKVQL